MMDDAVPITKREDLHFHHKMSYEELEHAYESLTSTEAKLAGKQEQFTEEELYAGVYNFATAKRKQEQNARQKKVQQQK